jgi:hypothetical protein
MNDSNKDELHGKNINLLSAGINIGGPSANIEGAKDIENPNPDESFSKLELDTLDEPIVDTLKRDLVRMVHKLEYVLIPRTIANQNKQLRNCNHL